MTFSINHNDVNHVKDIESYRDVQWILNYLVKSIFFAK